MNNRLQTDIWISRVAIALALVVVVSILGVIVLALIAWPALELLSALGTVALAGLARLLASPLNRDLFN